MIEGGRNQLWIQTAIFKKKKEPLLLKLAHLLVLKGNNSDGVHFERKERIKLIHNSYSRKRSQSGLLVLQEIIPQLVILGHSFFINNKNKSGRPQFHHMISSNFFLPSCIVLKSKSFTNCAFNSGLPTKITNYVNIKTQKEKLRKYFSLKIFQ